MLTSIEYASSQETSSTHSATGSEMKPNFKSVFQYSAILILLLMLLFTTLFMIGTLYSNMQEDYIKGGLENQIIGFDELKEKAAERIGIPAGSVTDEAIRAYLLKEIDLQVKWQWHHEFVNRRHLIYLTYSGWLVDVLLLAGSIVLVPASLSRSQKGSSESDTQEGTKGQGEDQRLLNKSVVAIFTFLAFLNLLIPTIGERLGYADRQEAHDYKARQLSLLRTELEMRQVSPEMAWEDYRRIHGKPINQFIRELKR